MGGHDFADHVVAVGEADAASLAVSQQLLDHPQEGRAPRAVARPGQRAEDGAGDGVELAGDRTERLVVRVGLRSGQGVPDDVEVVRVYERHEAAL
jgi:hypothetical protein